MPQRICLQCRSTKFKKDSNGSLICRNGHQLDELTEITEDAMALIGSQRTKRSKGKRKKEDETKYEKPDRAQLTIVQLQELLVNQVSWMIKNKNVPAQYNNIVRDLWLIWISNTFNVNPDLDLTANVDFELSSLNFYHSVIFCHIGCIILRLPFFLQDFKIWSVNEDFPYYVVTNRTNNSMKILDTEILIKQESMIISHLQNMAVEIPSFDQPLVISRLLAALSIPGSSSS